MKKISKEIVNERIENRGLLLIGDYINLETKSKFRCQHGHVWETLVSSVIKGSGCPHCAHSAPLTKEIVNDRIKDRGLTLVGDYVGVLTKSKFRCHHGHEWLARPSHVMAGDGCPICSGRLKLTKEIVNERIDHKGLLLIGDYLNNRTKTKFKCVHGHMFEATPKNVMLVAGCPICNNGGGFNQHRPGTFYILDFVTFIKYGITNDLTRRLKEHKSNGEYSIILTQLFESGIDAKNLEREIKQVFGGDFVTKDQLSNGWTETLCPSNIDKLLLMVKQIIKIR